jgi:hypothetical protein
MELKLDATIRCTDGVSGTLSDVIVDPGTRTITHVVVTADGDVARLVPIALVASPETLSCASEALREFDAIREYAFLRLDEFPHGDDRHDVGVETMITVPDTMGEIDPSSGLVYDLIPKGDAELRQTSDVYSADRHRLGNLYSVVHERGALTHVLYHSGHWWWSRRRAIPIAEIAEIATDTVTTRLARAEVDALPKLAQT